MANCIAISTGGTEKCRSKSGIIMHQKKSSFLGNNLASHLYFFDNAMKVLILRSDNPVSYTHLRAHETVLDIVCRLLLEKKNETATLCNTTLNVTAEVYHRHDNVTARI